jgi:hypothetical protein
LYVPYQHHNFLFSKKTKVSWTIEIFEQPLAEVLFVDLYLKYNEKLLFFEKSNVVCISTLQITQTKQKIVIHVFSSVFPSITLTLSLYISTFVFWLQMRLLKE